jgi:uncharacterized protein YjbJ (UPF0337 family)
MNKDQMNGTIDEVVGSAKRKVGELTNDNRLQAKGVTQQVKGKVEQSLGKTKDAVRKVVEGTRLHIDTHAELSFKDSTAGTKCNESK